MSKKHFIALADHLRANGVNEFEPEVIKILADFCQSQNPRFNRERWLAYIEGECGPNGGGYVFVFGPDYSSCSRASNRIADLVYASYFPGDQLARKVAATATWAEIIASELGINVPE